MTDKHFVIVLNQNGGGGKTTISRSLACLSELSEKKLRLIDSDGGNFGLLRAEGSNRVVALPWSLPDDALAQLVDEQNETDIIVLDTGANCLVMGSPFGATLEALMSKLEAVGFRVVIVVPAATNKIGDAEGALRAIDVFVSSSKDILIVENDRDGSAAFDPRLRQTGLPVVSFPNIAAGINTVLSEHRGPIRQFLTAPKPGFRRASAIVAKKLLNFAAQEPVRFFLNDSAITELKTLSFEAPKSLHFVVRTRDCAKDQVLDLNQRVASTRHQFKSTKPNEPQFMQVAEDYWQACYDWSARETSS